MLQDELLISDFLKPEIIVTDAKIYEEINTIMARVNDDFFIRVFIFFSDYSFISYKLFYFRAKIFKLLFLCHLDRFFD